MNSKANYLELIKHFLNCLVFLHLYVHLSIGLYMLMVDTDTCRYNELGAYIRDRFLVHIPCHGQARGRTIDRISNVNDKLLFK